MKEKYLYKIPEIDLFKITEKEYFYNVKKEFLSKDDEFRDHETFNEFMSNPISKLDRDDITIQEYMFSKNDSDREYIGDKTFNFYEDYLIPAIEKSKKAYVLNIKKEIKQRIHHKDGILLDLFSDKNTEVKNLLSRTKAINEPTVNNFKVYLESSLNDILDKVSLLENTYLPSEKINLSLNKAESLLLFHALYEKGVFTKETDKAELGRFIDKNVTYRKQNKDIKIKKAYDSLSSLLPSIKTGIIGQPLSNASFQRLEKIEDGLFDFLEK